VRAIARVVADDPTVELAVLFGSTARGTATSSSDLDVGVMGPSPERLPPLAVALSRAAGREVDLISLDTAPPLLRFEVAREGTALFERHPHRWSDFRARAMVDWWDWAPYARRFATAAARRLRSQVQDGPA